MGQVVSEQCCGNNSGDAETEGTDAVPVLVPSTEITQLTGAGDKGVSPCIPSAAKVSESKGKPKDAKTTAPAAKAPAAKESASGGGGKPPEPVAKAAKKKPAPVSTAKTVSLESLKTLTDMGFDETAATTALEAANGNIDQAVVMLSAAATAAPAERWDPGSPRAPATKPPRKRQLEALQEKVNMLTAMGFSEQQAKDSLEASGGDVESAVSWAGEVVVGTLG